VSKLPTEEIESGSSENIPPSSGNLWSTPTAFDHTNIKKPRKNHPGGGQKPPLQQQVTMWPTPRATERMGYYEQPSPSMIKGTHGWSLPAAVTDEASEKSHRMWPTPRSSKIMNMTMESALNRIENTGYHSNLEEKVALEEQKMLPTPTARDYKGARKPETLKKAGRNENNSLPDKIAAYQKGTLNPEWVEWLMGYPPGWTDITDLSESPTSQE